MKILMVFALVGLMAVMVSAHSREDNSDSHDGDRGRPGNRCVCGTQCTGNIGTKNIGCRKSRTQYLQCVDAVCSNLTCAITELFNATSGACEACPKGLHVDATRSRCVCDNGTTPDFKTRTCGPCPTGSIQTADKCSCSAPLVLNKVANACQACPENATRSGKDCRCINSKQFWNERDFACQPCPGVWVSKIKGERKRQYTIEICQCSVATEVFNEETVSCAACPANSNLVAGSYGNDCQCTLQGQKYDDDTNTCVDRNALDSDDSSQFY